MQTEAEMVEFEQDRRTVVELLDAPFPVRLVIEFTPGDGGTRLDWTATVSPQGLLSPAAGLLTWFHRVACEKDLRNLKAMMDRSRRAASPRSDRFACVPGDHAVTRG
jgi:hypothetical protein